MKEEPNDKRQAVCVKCGHGRRCTVWVTEAGFLKTCNCKCEFPAPRGARSPVDEALAELREMWSKGSFKIMFSSELPRCRIMVLREEFHSVHTPVCEGDTLDEAMGKVREYYQQAQKGGLIKMCDCEGGWLPTDGRVNVHASEMTPKELSDYIGIPSMLIPTEYTPCFHCNPLSWSNEDLECVV